MFAVVRTLALWVFVWVIWSFLKRASFFPLPSVQVHLFRSLSSLWYWENFLLLHTNCLYFFFVWLLQIKTSVRSGGDNGGAAADLQLHRWSVSEDKKASGVTRVDRDEGCWWETVDSAQSGGALSLSLSQQMEVVQLFFFFLSSLKVQKMILEKCVESRSRVVNYRHVEFPRLSNIDTFHDTIYNLYMLHFHRYNRFYNSYRFRQQTLKCWWCTFLRTSLDVLKLFILTLCWLSG